MDFRPSLKPLLCCLALLPLLALAQQRPHIVIIGIDGLSPAGLKAAATPNVDSLLQRGAHTFRARAVRPTSSSSNWTSMISGAGVEQHGVTSNDWERDNFLIYPAAVGDEGLFPSMFSVFRKYLPKQRSAAFFHWKGMGRLLACGAIDHCARGETETATAAAFAEHFVAHKPLLSFIQLDHVDGAGHRHGHLSAPYLEAIARADSLVGQMVQAVRQAGVLEQCVFMLSSDHGFKGHGHGGDTMDEVLIPFLISGPGIRAGIAITDPIYIYDIAATAVHLLGLPLPRAWTGKPAYCALEGQACEPDVDLGELALAPPRILPDFGGYAGPGGQFRDSVTAFLQGTDGVAIYYTTDGSQPGLSSPRYEGRGIVFTESALLRARSMDQAGRSSLAVAANFRIIGQDDRPAVKWAYYEIDGLNALPVFQRLEPKKTGMAFEMAPDTSILNRYTHIALTYEAWLRVPKAGKYRFYTVSDDGSKLYVGDRQVVDNDGNHGMKEASGSMELEAGLHPIRLEYYNGGGGGWFEVYWAGPGMPKQFIFPEQLAADGQ